MYLEYHIIILAVVFDLSLSTTNIKENLESSPDQPSTGERVKARLKELGIDEGKTLLKAWRTQGIEIWVFIFH